MSFRLIVDDEKMIAYAIPDPRAEPAATKAGRRPWTPQRIAIFAEMNGYRLATAEETQEYMAREKDYLAQPWPPESITDSFIDV